MTCTLAAADSAAAALDERGLGPWFDALPPGADPRTVRPGRVIQVTDAGAAPAGRSRILVFETESDGRLRSAPRLAYARRGGT